MSGLGLPAEPDTVDVELDFDFDVVVVGSANLDLVVRSPRIPSPGETLLGTAYDEFPGGKGLNQAVAASRSGARVAFVGAFGNDDAGRTLRQVATDAGIDLTAAATVPSRPTGRALITVDDGGENTIIVVPGANATVAPGPFARSRVVLAQLEIPAGTVEAAFAAARRSGATTVLNPAPAAALTDRLLELTDVIVPNEHEVELIGGVDRLLARGVKTVIVTRGAAGAEVVQGGGAAHATATFPALPVVPIDTTGAGDAFCGALAARLSSGASLEDAVRWAIAAGGLSTTVVGAVPSIPFRKEISARLTGAGGEA